MLSPYRAIFAVPGAKAFSSAGLLGRMPISMLGIGIVTMVSQVTGRYGLAGALSATLALAASVLGPQISRRVDRYGQRRVLRPVTACAVLAVVGLLVCVRADAPDWTLFVFCATAGVMPSLGSMVRARWAGILRGRPELHTAYAFESVVDELCFVVGPILSIGLCTAWFAEAGPLLAVVFLAVGTLLFTAQRSTEPVPHPREPAGGRSVLRSRGLVVVALTFVAVGTIFGSVDVATVAFADERGHKAAASLVLAVYALGSGLAGAVFGLLQPKRRASHRLILGVGAMAVSMIPLLLVGNLPFLAGALFVAGLSVAPTMVTAMALIEQLVPRAKLTEGMTWATTGITVGVALGASLAGLVTDSAGARTAFAVPAVAGAAAASVAVLGYRRLRPAPEWEGPRTHEQYEHDRPDRKNVA